MINWREVHESGFRLKIPETLRRMRLGPLFKGRIVKGAPSTELVVLLNPEVSATYLSDCRQGFSKPPPFTQWEGSTWTYHIWGASKTRPDGWEIKTSETVPNPCGRAYRWTRASSIQL